VVVSTHSKALILRYVPISRPKEGELPFIGFIHENAEDDIINEANEATIIALKGYKPPFPLFFDPYFPNLLHFSF